MTVTRADAPQGSAQPSAIQGLAWRQGARIMTVIVLRKGYYFWFGYWPADPRRQGLTYR